jgi:hypothetical protein
LKALVPINLVVDKSSDADVSKLMPEIKVPSNVVSDTALRGLAAKLHTGDVLRGCLHRRAPLRKEGVSSVAK